jgi:hypothetical protein
LDSCCWNRLVGLPKTKNEEKPIFDYEIDILRLLEGGEEVENGGGEGENNERGKERERGEGGEGEEKLGEREKKSKESKEKNEKKKEKYIWIKKATGLGI